MVAETQPTVTAGCSAFWSQSGASKWSFVPFRGCILKITFQFLYVSNKIIRFALKRVLMTFCDWLDYFLKINYYFLIGHPPLPHSVRFVIYEVVHNEQNNEHAQCIQRHTYKNPLTNHICLLCRSYICLPKQFRHAILLLHK